MSTDPQLSTGVQLDGPEDEDAQDSEHAGFMPLSPALSALSVVRISQGDGKFVLTTAWPDPPLGITVDIAAGALRLKSGRTSRWLPLPHDALVDQAVIERSEEALVVTIPERNRRNRRNIVHVW
jgi:hypothetical protein